MDLTRFLRFCCVGIANVVVDFAVYYMAAFLISIYPARVLAWTVACLFSYFVNRNWTFHAKVQGFLPIVRFGVVNLASLALGLLLLWIFSWLGASKVLAYMYTLPFTTLTNYLGYSLWSFQHTEAGKI